MPKGFATSGINKGWIQKGSHGPRYGTGELFRDKTCQACGKKFRHLSPKKKTCSVECEYKLRHKNNRLTRICVVCRKEFEVEPCWLKGNKQTGTYCSPECHFANKSKYTAKEKRDAVNRVNTDIKFRGLQRQPCIICGDKDTHAHHHKGYAKEHQLDIVWLCKKHHMEEHERLRKYGLINFL